VHATLSDLSICVSSFSDAPAVSTGQENAVSNLSLQSNQNDTAAGGAEADNQGASGEQWDDEALAATLNRKAAAHATGNVLDMKALDPRKGSEHDNIAEKLRVEENKAKLAAAREGMEREAQRIKEEKDKKSEAASGGAPRFGAAAANTAASTGGRWVPPHMRAGALPKIRMGAAGGMPQKVDTQNEELFPDLAKAADIIEQQQKQQQPVYKAKKTPVGGGATWASKPKINKPDPATKKAQKPTPEPAATPAPTAAATEKEKPAASSTGPDEATAPSAAAKTATKPLVKKKKKKDLSTFKG
jgi:hypothetical protein